MLQHNLFVDGIVFFKLQWIAWQNHCLVLLYNRKKSLIMRSFTHFLPFFLCNPRKWNIIWFGVHHLKIDGFSKKKQKFNDFFFRKTWKIIELKKKQYEETIKWTHIGNSAKIKLDIYILYTLYVILVDLLTDVQVHIKIYEIFMNVQCACF
jgi:hypothetical protein